MTPRAWSEIKGLPGHIRQRVRREVDALAGDPRPSRSRQMDVPEIRREVRRLRLERWRVVYAIDDTDKIVDVVAVRKRPPYDYGDLAELLTGIA